VRIFDGYGEVELQIVPDVEPGAADEHQISVMSALGKALLGRMVGEEVRGQTSTGIYFVRIRDVT
jgi:transcription elongation GreA/GreB family factor